jgi:hypothetical protein
MADAERTQKPDQSVEISLHMYELAQQSWTAEVSTFGVVVRIEQVVSQAPRESFQRSHSPANANSAPSLTSKQNGCFDFPVRLPSRGPTLLLVPPLRTVRESFQLTRLKLPGTLRS